MPWIESHTVLRTHRKILPLSRALRLNIAQTIGHLHLLWHAALEQQENGDLSRWSDELIAELAGFTGDAPQFVRLLQEFGWLDGKTLHDLWDYAGRYLQGKYSRTPEKWKAIQSLHTNSTQTADKQHTIPNLPNQTNQTIKALSCKHDLVAPILYLNEKAKKSFDPKNKATSRLIMARYNEGRTLDNFKVVIDRKCSEWLTDAKMMMYLRPSTLFNATNFENYLNQNGGKNEWDRECFRTNK